MKKNKHFSSHTNPSPKGMGDYYGTGVKAKVGTMISGAGQIKATKAQVGKSPKALA